MGALLDEHTVGKGAAERPSLLVQDPHDADFLRRLGDHLRGRRGTCDEFTLRARTDPPVPRQVEAAAEALHRTDRKWRPETRRQSEDHTLSNGPLSARHWICCYLELPKVVQRAQKVLPGKADIIFLPQLS